jgi:hypothetical protein
VDAAQDADFLRRGEGRLKAGRLDAVAQPMAAVGVLDVCVFDADVAAIGLLKGGDDVAELLLTAAEVGAGIKGRVEVGGREVELLKGEFGDRGGRAAERIEVRLKVGASQSSNDTVFVLLVDPDTLETKFQSSTTVGSSFNFSLANVTPGNYLLVAGTDRDNDDLLGDAGELFGAWPNLDNPQPIAVTAGVNSSDLDFGMQDLVTVASFGGLPAGAALFRRLR